jgi:hypothetical protein
MEDLSSLIPVIKRARGYRLYALSGRRYLDLSLSGGYNLLGHKPKAFVNNLKQVCEKGLLSDLPSVYGKRLLKALRDFFPDYRTFFTAASMPELLAAAGAALGSPLTASDIRDPLLKSNPDGRVNVWRPFFTGNVMSDIILPLIPTGIGPSLYIICLRRGAEPTLQPVPVHSPLLLAAVLHSLLLLRSLQLPSYYRPDLLTVSRHFEQKDIYLIPRCSAAEYRAVFVHPPRYPGPGILPFELSAGELQNLLGLFDNEKEDAP